MKNIELSAEISNSVSLELLPVRNKFARFGFIGLFALGTLGSGCLEIPPAKYAPTSTPIPRPTVISLGGTLPDLDPRYNAIAKLLADSSSRNAVSDEDRKYFNDQTEAYNERQLKQNEPELWAFSKTLPREMGIVKWDGKFVIYGGSGGSVNADVRSTNPPKVELIDVKIPSFFQEKALTPEQKIIVLRKEVVGTMEAVNYLMLVLDPLISSKFVPAGERAVLADGLAALTLTPEKRAKIGLNNSGLKLTLDGRNAQILEEDTAWWDGKRNLNEKDLAAIITMSKNDTIVSGGIPYYTSKIKELIANGTLK